MLNHMLEGKKVTKRGAFIVIEGLDGSGKTTQAKMLAAKLRQSHRALFTAEPSEGRIGAFIRNGCLYESKRLHPEVEALLFAADRIEHVETEIKPALKDGHLVISDRYVYSSLAYQGSTGLSLTWIKTLNKHALKPDFAVFIDISPETVLKRLERRKSVMENLETQRRVREIYLKFVKKGELVAIDGDKPESNVFEALVTTVSQFLKGFRGDPVV
jgi:dTMP kinase